MRDRWFEDIIAQLRVDQLQLSTNTAPPEKRQRYDALIEGSAEGVLLVQQGSVTRHFVERLVRQFVKGARPHLARIKTLAATANDSEVLMWIELRREDELLEDQLTLLEAEVNAQFHDWGYDLDLMIVEATDAIPVPEHYSVIYRTDESLPGTPTASE